MSGEILLQTVLTGILWGCVYALIAVGLTLIFGVMDVVNFAHGDFMMVAMYVVYALNVALGLDPLLSLPVAAAALGLLGVATHKLLIRRVLGGPMLAQIFVTFGLMIFLRGVAQAIFSPNYLTVRNPWVAGRLALLGVSVPTPQVVAAAGAALITALMYWFVMRTETGWTLLAVAENRQAAALVGIDAERVYTLAWGLGAASVGVAGALLANFYYLFPEVGAIFGLMAYVTVALGGFGSVAGALAAGVVIGLVESLGGLFLEPRFKYVLVFSVYVLVMLLRPRGLMGRA